MTKVEFKLYLEPNLASQITETTAQFRGAGRKVSRNEVLEQLIEDGFRLWRREAQVVNRVEAGIAKLLDPQEHAPEQTRNAARAFTLHYAAPEQVRGEAVTTMTDVYALGVVLHELLSGGKPYRPTRDTAASWEQAILDADPLRPSLALQRDGAGLEPGLRRRMVRAIAGDLDNIVLRALAKRPEDRYPSVEALAQDLRRWLDVKPVLARPQPVGYRLRKYIARHRWGLAATTAVVGLLAGALGAVNWQAGQAIEESARAQAMQAFVVGLFEHAGAGPGNAALDVRALLDAGVQRGDAELARQPLPRAELYGVIARLRLGLGDYAQALDLLQRQDALLDTLPRAPASLRLQSAGDHARALRMLGRQPACIARADALRPLARQRETALPRQAAELYTQLGRCHRDQGAYAEARTLFDAALHYDIDQFRIGLNANNLFDKEYVTSCGSVGGCYYGNRLAVISTLTYRW